MDYVGKEFKEIESPKIQSSSIVQIYLMDAAKKKKKKKFRSGVKIDTF